MASKSSSPGPNPTTPTPASKQARSRKAASHNTDVGRAGSAGGIVLEKEKGKAAPTPKPKQAQETADKTPRRKPRKLNKEATSSVAAPASKDTVPAEPPSTAEIEALKLRVRELEAKVEELYKSGSLDRSVRSPRRRGKGRKGSSQQQVATLSSTKAKPDDENDDKAVEEMGRGDADEEEGVEELVRLEGELESARQDLAAFGPRGKGATWSRTKVDDADQEDVEEVARQDQDRPANARHVTLSGSYRIPLPASVSVDDVKTIQSGVSAAQNVARSFLEQRRAANALKSSPAAAASSSSAKKASPRPGPRSVSSSMEVIPVQDAGGKQSWGEWIGGYSVAISRAVKNMEHEAAVESQRGSGSSTTRKKQW
ncbi:hypothetical protein ACEQ8H_007960 [Pleosporales sp. CAS-2024a]